VCENCGSDGERVVADLKPVFELEREYIASQIDRPRLLDLPLSLLWMRNKTLYYKGKHHIRLSVDDRLVLAREYNNQDESVVNLPSNKILIKANKSSLRYLEREAIDFIRNTASELNTRIPIVSFSGGKDSAVVSHLVRKALGRDDIAHVFADTTIEYPDTYDYVNEFCKKNPRIPFEVARAERDWFEMCDCLEPPSRILRWCCTVFKSSPLAKALNSIGDSSGILNFEGLRRCESNRRRNAQRIYKSKKIAHQISAEPIIEWSDLAVWLYLLTNRIEYNRAYDRGFARVGCLFCPYNNRYSELIMESSFFEQRLGDSRYSKKIKPWKDYLLAYARKRGKEDAETYVAQGVWKARAGTEDIHVSAGQLARHPGVCGGEVENEYNLSKPVTTTLYDMFKPLGILSQLSHKDLGIFMVHQYIPGENGQRVNGQPLFQFQAIPGWTRVRVTILANKGKYLLRQRIEKQLKRFQACVECGGCVGVCPTGAITCGSPLQISDEKCRRCGLCYSSKIIKYGCITLHSRSMSKKYLAAKV
jgi:phosphoadenosine phosphosulfate reductase